MKNKDFCPEQFQGLNRSEQLSCSGGGFAYDVGRFLRFVVISGGTANVHMAIADAVINAL